MTAGNVGDGTVAETLIEPELEEAKKADASEPVEIYGDASYGTADLGRKARSCRRRSQRQGTGTVTVARRALLAGPFQGRYTGWNRVLPGGCTGQAARPKGWICDCQLLPVVQLLPTAHKVHGLSVRPRAEDPSQVRDTRALPSPPARTAVEAALSGDQAQGRAQDCHLMRRRHGGRRARMRGCERSGMTSLCSPLPSTWPVWPLSASSDAPGGPSPQIGP